MAKRRGRVKITGKRIKRKTAEGKSVEEATAASRKKSKKRGFRTPK